MSRSRSKIFGNEHTARRGSGWLPHTSTDCPSRVNCATRFRYGVSLGEETAFNLARAPRHTVLDPDRCATSTDHASIVAAVRLLTATLYPVNICSLLGFRFASVDGFFGHVAGIVMILPRLLFARLFLVWVLIVGHRHAPWNFVSCKTITQLHERCSTEQTRRATIKIISEPAYTVWRVSLTTRRDTRRFPHGLTWEPYPGRRIDIAMPPPRQRIWRRDLGNGPLTVEVGAFSLPGVLQLIASDIRRWQ